MRKEKEEEVPGGIISSKEEWENISENWLDKSFQDRLSAIEILRIQYLELFEKSKVADFSVFGKRI